MESTTIVEQVEKVMKDLKALNILNEEEGVLCSYSKEDNMWIFDIIFDTYYDVNISESVKKAFQSEFAGILFSEDHNKLTFRLPDC